MRVMIIVNALTYGGAERQAVTDANLLAEYGHHVTFGYKKAGDLLQVLSSRVRLYNIRHQFMPVASFELLLHLLRHKYNVIHCHLFWAAMISMIPAVITRHHYVFNEHGLGNWRRWYHLLLIRQIYRFSSKVITPIKDLESSEYISFRRSSGRPYKSIAGRLLR